MTISFDSEFYKPIFWNNIFCDSGNAIFPEKKQVGLMNNTGLIMMGDVVSPDSNMTIISESQRFEIAACQLDGVSMPLLEQSGIFLFRIKNKIAHPAEKNTEYYFNLMNQILLKTYHACYTIFLCTRDHLSSRYYGESKIAHLDSVHFIFSDAIVLFKRLEPFILKCETPVKIKKMTHIDFALTQILEINKHLAKLGGARAVLTGNVVDFSFHLLFFKNFIG